MSVNIVDFPVVKRPGATLIAPAIEPSMASLLAVEYVSEALGLKEVGFMRMKGLQAPIYAIDGVLRAPCRLLYNSNYPLIAFRTAIKIPEELEEEIASQLIEWAERNEVERLVILSTIEGEGEDVYVATESWLLEKYLKYGFRPIEKTVIKDFSAALLSECLLRRIDGVIIYAETPIYSVLKRISSKLQSGEISEARANELISGLKPDVKASLKLVEAVRRITGLEFDLSELKELAEKFSGVYSQILMELASTERRLVIFK